MLKSQEFKYAENHHKVLALYYKVQTWESHRWVCKQSDVMLEHHRHYVKIKSSVEITHSLVEGACFEFGYLC